MDAGRRHAEVPLEVGLRRRTAVNFRVLVDEREVLALLLVYFLVGGTRTMIARRPVEEDRAGFLRCRAAAT